MRELDELVKEMVQNEDNYDKLTRPVCAFITFESDDGYNEALTFSKKGWFNKGDDDASSNEKLEILGKEAIFIAATEPTNIIWENRYIKGFNLYSRAGIAVLLIAIMLSLAFSVTLIAKRFAINNASTFIKLDCNKFEEGLKLDGWNEAQFKTEFRRYAGLEYLTIEAQRKKGVKAPMSGPLQCFCDGQFKKNKADYILKERYQDPHIFLDVSGVE